MDGTFSKRKGRYINDGIGKEQNAVMKMIEVNNRPHLAVFATRKILKGEEIRYDYGVTNLPWRSKTIYRVS
ncbi:hypothetical protein KUTeg_011496 [Tegillarca granosa]|uniref:SET domain-containing protein n=1 Tax=Tegillarca granosa TaxID=220873 RepID=A0ABQ9ERN4_TEGGR|nr:hypothetical protein KUTeg_014566 [Tegillarca granosa]KAJ8310952.1 hypothetical protein KUTeg_011496 [Tegillarca granosa]